MYSESMHPFVRALVEADERGHRLPLANWLMLRAQARYEDDKRLMYQIADRRRHPLPEGQSDILDTTLQFGADLALDPADPELADTICGATGGLGLAAAFDFAGAPRCGNRPSVAWPRRAGSCSLA